MALLLHVSQDLVVYGVYNASSQKRLSIQRVVRGPPLSWYGIGSGIIRYTLPTHHRSMRLMLPSPGAARCSDLELSAKPDSFFCTRRMYSLTMPSMATACCADLIVVPGRFNTAALVHVTPLQCSVS